MRLPVMFGAVDSVDTRTADDDGRFSRAGTDAVLAEGRYRNCNYQKSAGNHSRRHDRSTDQARQAHTTNWCWIFRPDFL